MIGGDTVVSANSVSSELRILLARKQSELEELEAMLEAVREDAHAIERTLGFFPNGTEDRRICETTAVTPRELSGMKQMDALDYIATKTGGRIRVNDAKQLLIDAGLVKGQRRLVYGHIYNLLKQSDRYERAGRGEFQKRQGALGFGDTE